ncbi:hypothetical protein [Methylocystis echinoides]|uniref:bestrophin-like domain n=1 Tax=Methylocystis echinoides TaxID=29468 RepID=UPI00341CECFA
MFEDAPLWAIFLLSVALFGIASETGHWLALGSRREANIATIEASILGLLALMLSFSFAMAVTRFDERRAATLKEANAIGTAALRARLLPSPYAAESLDLLRDYVAIRSDAANVASTPTEAAIARSNELQERLWRVVRAAAARDNAMVPTGLYIQALNDMVDAHEGRLTAFRHRVPHVIIVALYGMAALAIGFTGYASGLERKRWRLPVYLVTILVAAVILLIQDIDRPDSGSVRVSAEPLSNAAASIAGYARAAAGAPERVPPLPAR